MLAAYMAAKHIYVGSLNVRLTFILAHEMPTVFLRSSKDQFQFL